MQIVVKGAELKAPLLLQPHRPMDDDEFYAFCGEHPELRLERTAEGDIAVMPPAGNESSFQSAGVVSQLYRWSKRDGRGRVFDSSAGFVLPNGACLSPDASWVLRSRLERFQKEQRRKFLPLCPDFVVEVLSPTDRLPHQKSKLQQWIDNGARLAWLLDPDRRTAYIYRPDREPEKLVHPNRLHGEAPVASFILDLADIWAGL